MNRFGHGQAPRQYGPYWPYKNKTQWLAAENETLRKALVEISERVDALETGDQKPVDFAELRGLQETANKAIGKNR